MVEMLLAFPARDATMAAVSAANARPFRPEGRRFSSVGYAWSGFTTTGCVDHFILNIPFGTAISRNVLEGLQSPAPTTSEKAANKIPLRAVFRSAPNARWTMY